MEVSSHVVDMHSTIEVVTWGCWSGWHMYSIYYCSLLQCYVGWDLYSTIDVFMGVAASVPGVQIMATHL